MLAKISKCNLGFEIFFFNRPIFDRINPNNDIPLHLLQSDRYTKVCFREILHALNDRAKLTMREIC